MEYERYKYEGSHPFSWELEVRTRRAFEFLCGRCFTIRPKHQARYILVAHACVTYELACVDCLTVKES